MDASGKDGTVRKIFSGVNPLGCRVYSFKAPTHEELAHDFLWRVHKITPEKGMIHVFNRSHYEDILVPLVEDIYPKKYVDERYELINDFEKLLAHNNTTVLKFYLHISPEEQKRRLTERLQNPEKYWKHNDNDRESRAKWDEYVEVYHTIFSKCNDVPWHVIPSDENRWRIYLIAKKIVETLKEMHLTWPGLETEKFAAIVDNDLGIENGHDHAPATNGKKK